MRPQVPRSSLLSFSTHARHLELHCPSPLPPLHLPKRLLPPPPSPTRVSHSSNAVSGPNPPGLMHLDLRTISFFTASREAASTRTHTRFPRSVQRRLLARLTTHHSSFPPLRPMKTPFRRGSVAHLERPRYKGCLLYLDGQVLHGLSMGMTGLNVGRIEARTPSAR